MYLYTREDSQAVEIRTSTNLRFVVSDESPLLQLVYYIYTYNICIYQAVEIRTSTNLWVCSECRISITNIVLNIIIENSVGIKQWRFELRTPLPKRGAQPLGHLPDKFEK